MTPRRAARAIAVLSAAGGAAATGAAGGAVAAGLVGGCSEDKPPVLGDPDAQRPVSDATFYGAPREAGAAGGEGGALAFATDYEGVCPTGYAPVWRYHDFMTKTPGASAIDFSAQTGASIAELATAPSAALAHVTGPDVTVWAGVDVDPKLRTVGAMSLHYLRVTTTFTAGEAGAPTLVDARQQYDCVANH